MNIELFLSWRYMATKRKEKFISLISIISVLGIAIGVAALIVVLAVMSGFDKDLREKIVGNYSHITLMGMGPITDTESTLIIKKILENPHVKSASAYIQGQVLIKENKRFFAVGVKGVDPLREQAVTKITVPPYWTVTEPLACLAIFPVSKIKSLLPNLIFIILSCIINHILKG